MDTKRNGHGHRRRGAALIASLFVVMTVAFLGAALIQISTSNTRRQIQVLDTKRAFYMAEAGLSEAFLAVYQGKSGNVGTQEVPARYGDGIFWVEAAELDGDRLTLTSTGLCGTGRFALSMVLEKQINPLAMLGVFGTQQVLVSDSCVVDGYDSRAGTWMSQVDPSLPVESTGQGASINSNGDVYVDGSVSQQVGAPTEPSTFVYGDARPGPQGTASVGPGALVTGSTVPNLTDLELPTVEPPDMPSQGSFVHDGGTTLLLTNQDLRYDELRVGTGSTVRVEGPAILVVSEFVLERGAELILDSTAGPVSVFATDYLYFDTGSVLGNAGKDPSSVAFTVGASEWADRDGDGVDDPPVTLLSRGTFYGFLYSPGTDLRIPRSVRMFGGVAAQHITLNRGAHVTFDQALMRSSSSTLIPGMPKLVTWRIVDLPSADVVRLRIDPFTALGIAKGDLPPAPEAHHEQEFQIEYRDLGGATQTYTGPAKDFDPSTATRILSTSWIPDSWVGANGPGQMNPNPN